MTNNNITNRINGIAATFRTLSTKKKKRYLRYVQKMAAHESDTDIRMLVGSIHQILAGA